MSTKNMPDAKMPKKLVYAIYALYDEADPESDTCLGCFTDRRKAKKAFLAAEASSRFDVVSLLTLGVYTRLGDWFLDHAPDLEGDDE